MGINSESLYRLQQKVHHSRTQTTSPCSLERNLTETSRGICTKPAILSEQNSVPTSNRMHEMQFLEGQLVSLKTLACYSWSMIKIVSIRKKR